MALSLFTNENIPMRMIKDVQFNHQLFFKQRRSKRVFRAASRQKKHKVRESRQCFARDEIHPSSYVPWVEVELLQRVFFGISCLSIFKRGEREVNTSWFESGTLKRLSRGAKYMPLLLPASHAHANLFYSTFAIGLKIQKQVCSFFNLQPLSSGLQCTITRALEE